MSANTTRSKNVIDKLKRVLLNYDLLIEYSKGEMALVEAKMNDHKGKKNKYSQRLFIIYKVKYERFYNFFQEINAAKEKLLNNINNILNIYNIENREIIYKYYFENKKMFELAEEYKMDLKIVRMIINEFDKQIISFYF